jgi:hypothetical protein
MVCIIIFAKYCKHDISQVEEVRWGMAADDNSMGRYCHIIMQPPPSCLEPFALVLRDTRAAS